MARLHKASLAELKAELAKKEQEAAKLVSERGAVAAKIAKLDKQIAEICGGAEAGPAPAPVQARRGRKPGRKPGPKPAILETDGRKRRGTVIGAIRDVLREAAEPMNIAAIVEGLKIKQVKSKSKDLANLVRQTVLRAAGIKRVARGLYAAE